MLRQLLRRDLRRQLLQFLNYALLAALILIAGALGPFTNLPLYASILDLPRISGQQFTVAVQLAALALAALALVPTRRVGLVRNLAVLSFNVFLAVSLAPAAYLESAGRAIVVAKETASVIAGWTPIPASGSLAQQPASAGAPQSWQTQRR